MTTTIKVDNLKCGGCANTIEKRLLSVTGIEKVIVNTETGEVRVTHVAMSLLDEIKEQLKKIGYPETGTTEGFEKVSSNLISYVSCAVGKISSKK